MACFAYRWSDNLPLNFTVWAPKYLGEHSLTPSYNKESCAAGPCSTSFGLCEVSCSRKLSYICMARKILQTETSTVTERTPSVTVAPVVSEPVLSGSTNAASVTSATVVSEHELPRSMSMMGRMVMHLAEAVLPERTMGTISEIMKYFNRILFSGKIPRNDDISYVKS